MTEALVIKGLNKRFGGLRAVQDDADCAVGHLDFNSMLF